jgi:hypothetical protein
VGPKTNLFLSFFIWGWGWQYFQASPRACSHIILFPFRSRNFEIRVPSREQDKKVWCRLWDGVPSLEIWKQIESPLPPLNLLPREVNWLDRHHTANWPQSKNYSSVCVTPKSLAGHWVGAGNKELGASLWLLCDLEPLARSVESLLAGGHQLPARLYQRGVSF